MSYQINIPLTTMKSFAPLVCIATVVAAVRFNTFDSNSNTDSNGSPILTQAQWHKFAARQASGPGNGYYRRMSSSNNGLHRNRDGLFDEQANLNSDTNQDYLADHLSYGPGNGQNRRKLLSYGTNNYQNEYDSQFRANFNEADEYPSEPISPGRLNQAESGYDGHFGSAGVRQDDESLSSYNNFDRESSGFYGSNAGLMPKSSYRNPHNLGNGESRLNYPQSYRGSSSDAGYSSYNSDRDNDGEAEDEN